MPDAITVLARRLGVAGSYTDTTGERRRTSRATCRALLRAMGVAPEEAADRLAALEAEETARRLAPYHVCNDGAPPEAPGGDWRLSLEDGRKLEGRGPLPDLPLGLHRLRVGAEQSTLISCPARLPMPARCWGVMLPLQTLRSPDEGGLATLDDLAAAGEGIAANGAAFCGLNPIHAGFWGDPGNFSPYAPSHRRRLCSFFVTPSGAGHGAQAGPHVDFAKEIPARRAALEAEFAAFGGARGFEDFKAKEGEALRRFALHQALADRHGPYWDDWPEALQRADAPETATAERQLFREVAFHAWLQWRAETELGAVNVALHAAGMTRGLYLDLAVGTHPKGAETWEDPDSFARDVSLGAPPDAFAASGQSWGLAPLNPHQLVKTGFAALAETLRCQLRFCGALRVDHILGFHRAFWVPEDGAPGGYVAMPRDAMLAVLRLEAARAGAVIVGEDLGNVPRGLRATLADCGILGCQLQMFERDPRHPSRLKPPRDYPPRTIASFSTHDLPTWRGWRAGGEIRAHRDLGNLGEAACETALAARADEVARFDAFTAPFRPADTTAEDTEALHATLAATRSRLALVQIENVLEIETQPNLPGTIHEFPNWRQRLPVRAGEIGTHPGLVSTAALMAAAGR